MDKRLQSILNKYDPKLKVWTNAINEHNRLIFSSERINDMDKAYEITLNAVNSLASIFEVVIEFGKYKDSWDYSSFYQNVYGFDLIIKSTKLKIPFYLGLDNKGFYIRTELNNVENLKNMKDEFWLKLLSLTTIKGFEFSQYEGFSNDVKREHPELFYSYKSMTFLIFRKYFFDSIDKSDSRNEIGSLGEFRINWNDKTPFIDILAELCEVFKILYELKYSLWKVDELRKQKRAK